MRRGRWRAALHLGAAALLAGCALAPAEPAMTSSLIDQLPSDLPHAARRTGTLLVLRPEARPVYDTTRMAYSLRPHHVAYYSRNEWAETPPQMLQPLLVRALEGTGGFQAVLSPPYGGPSTQEVQAEVLELLQDFSREPAVLRLVLRISVTDAAQRSLGSREFVAQQPLPENSPGGGVRAANQAMAQALRDVAAFVLEQAR